VFSTGLASVLFFSVVRNTSAAFVANINFLIPIWAVLLGALVMNEQLPPTLAAGLALVLLGVGVAQRRTAPAPVARIPAPGELVRADRT
ncbi:MAG: EamA family transporter, partial [Xanthomonadales bacterium]|nr:EamA family transporter [Xanthomonadales bacterium]